jgi:hypothetical protein
MPESLISCGFQRVLSELCTQRALSGEKRLKENTKMGTVPK